VPSDLLTSVESENEKNQGVKTPSVMSCDVSFVIEQSMLGLKVF